MEQHAVAVPAPRLRPFVTSYVGYRYEGFAPGIHVGLPSRSLTFIVSFDSPVDVVAMPDPAQRPDRFFALVGGLHAAPALIRHDGNQHGVQLQLKPLGARALFGLPAAELASTVVSLDDVLGSLTRELRDRLEGVGHWVDRFAVLDDVLTRAITEPRPVRDEIAFTWDRLTATGGAAAVASLAREVGWSRRHLTERFRTEFGLPPKAMAKVLRFERAKELLVQPQRPPLARIAAECGYADQAHLTRDWRELAGSSPKAWLEAEVLPFVQDPYALDEAV